MYWVSVLDILLAGFLIGANAWFFFIQSPALIKMMGRDKFVPIQMRLTKILFRALSIAAVGLLILAWFTTDRGALLGAGIATMAALVAQVIIIPQALRAGGRGRAETMAKGGDNSVAKFASEGSGPSATFWHRMVVVFVVLILAGAVVNIGALVG